MQQPFSGLTGLQVHEVLGGRYRIVSKLGSGGMGTVYLAEDLRLPGKRWAVKESRMEGEESAAASAEADMLIRLQHPNLPEIVDYYPANAQGYRYLIMDYIEGETLQQRFERQGRRMPASQLISYVVQLCDLFHYLHTRRPEPVVYRDLKPSNLMIDLQEQIRLIDFGIARSFKAGQAMDTVPIGTVGFAAPEQFAGRQTDTRTDLYSLGALMYFVLSGGQYYHAARKPLGELDTSLPASLTGLVGKLLQAEPAARCQSAAEVRRELLRLLPPQAGGSLSQTRSGTAAGGAAAPRPRVLAVGALYAGAGATFAALAMARALQALGVPHAVLEPPTRQPELYALLFGEKHAPAGYRCYNDARGPVPWDAAPWIDGGTLWLPSAAGGGPDEAAGMEGRGAALAPSPASMAVAEAAAAPYGRPSAYSDGSAYWGAAAGEAAAETGMEANAGAHEMTPLRQLLCRLDRPVVVADIGSDWQQPAVCELLAAADDVVYVVEPLLHKLDSLAARRNLLQLDAARQSGKRVQGLANKAVALRQTGQWLKALPEPPACLLPLIDFSLIAEASWQGSLVQQHPAVEPQLVRALVPWLKILLQSHRPADAMNASGGHGERTTAPGTRRMLHKLWKNG
ncbi:hypothetical protein CF651_30940 [Paenibacillus rigui]|uniref:non-specific serine/threonine protein kinase n=2 Tax=Paenibacillus rigui TaxID=554312 RepID=A0A229UGD0_9BACL|nr:hypothetical protein CF651_30940 [Paenibacillus rigui]